MVSYDCPRCGYTTNLKGNIKKHINRKKICLPKLSEFVPKECENRILNKEIIIKQFDKLTCQHCDKTYSRPDVRKRHEETCKEKPVEIETKESDEGTAALLELVKTLNEQRKEDRQEMELLKDLVKKAGVTNYNTTNHNTMNIVILPYNETDVSHLKDRDFYNSISRCVLSVPRLINKIHFDKNKPENHNIYISNISKGHAMVWDGKKWLVKDQTDVVEDLIAENEYRLEDWVQEGQHKFPKAMEKFKLYVSKRDEKGVPEMVRKEVKMMLYNNRDMIEEITES